MKFRVKVISKKLWGASGPIPEGSIIMIDVPTVEDINSSLYELVGEAGEDATPVSNDDGSGTDGQGDDEATKAAQAADKAAAEKAAADAAKTAATKK